MIIQFDRKIQGAELVEAIKRIPIILNKKDPGWEISPSDRWVATKDGFEVKEISGLSLTKKIERRFLFFFTSFDHVEGFHFPNIKLNKFYQKIYLEWNTSGDQFYSIRYLDEEKGKEIVKTLFRILDEEKM